jgi:hypothetical protein
MMETLWAHQSGISVTRDFYFGIEETFYQLGGGGCAGQRFGRDDSESSGDTEAHDVAVSSLKWPKSSPTVTW